MNDPIFVGPNYFLRKQKPHGQIFADLTSHIVSLGGIDHRIFVGVFLFDLLIHPVDKGKDTIVCGVGLAGQLPPETVADIFLGHLVAAHLHNPLFHHILYVLYVGCVGKIVKLLFNCLGNGVNLVGIELVNLGDLKIGLGNGILNLGDLERNFLPVPLDNL